MVQTRLLLFLFLSLLRYMSFIYTPTYMVYPPPPARQLRPISLADYKYFLGAPPLLFL
jgi:hypothetical protein